MDLSDDDANSTQLEGKKLKKRGVKAEGYKLAGYQLSGQLLEIDEDSPLLFDGDEAEHAQEYFIEREFGEENEVEREERLKKEMNAARLQQQEQQKQQGEQIEHMMRARDPNLKLDEIEQGILQSQKKGRAVIKHNRNLPEVLNDDGKEPRAQSHKTDLAVVGFALGNNVKNLDLADDAKEKPKGIEGSIPATRVQDIRGKGAPGLEL